MGYRTEFNGKMTIQLSEAGALHLQNNLKDLGIQSLFELSANCVKVEPYWKNHGIFEDVLLYIEQNGKVRKGRFQLEGDNAFDKRDIQVENGILYEYRYFFNHKNEKNIPLSKVLEKLRIYPVKEYTITLPSKDGKLYHEIEDILIQHMSGEETFTKKNHRIFKLLKDNDVVIELKTPTFMILLTKGNLDDFSCVPFEKPSVGTRLTETDFGERRLSK